MLIYLYKHNQQYGPYPEASVLEWLSTGRCFPDDLAYREGMHEWQPLQNLFHGAHSSLMRLPTTTVMQPSVPANVLVRAPTLPATITVTPKPSPATPLLVAAGIVILLLTSSLSFLLGRLTGKGAAPSGAQVSSTQSPPVVMPTATPTPTPVAIASAERNRTTPRPAQPAESKATQNNGSKFDKTMNKVSDATEKGDKVVKAVKGIKKLFH